MTPVLDNTVKITSRWITTDAVVWMTTGTTCGPRRRVADYADRMGTYSA